MPWPIIEDLQNLIATGADTLTLGNTDFANDGKGIQNWTQKDNKGYTQYKTTIDKEDDDPQAVFDDDGGIKPKGVKGLPVGRPFELPLPSGKKRDYIIIKNSTLLKLVRDARNRSKRNQINVLNARILSLERRRR